MYYPLTVCAAAVVCALGAIASAQAQDSAPVPQVDVRAPHLNGTEAERQLREARAALARRAGATAVVDAATYTNGRAATAADALAWAPGVLAQTRHGQETRMSIRGSGIQRGFLMRGIALYQDGIPLNHADGTGDFQALDPAATRYIEVWRGSNALEYGANGLGGAVNFVSPTGLTDPGASLRLQAGSFGQRQAHASLGGVSGALDGYASISRSEQDGWRAQSAYKTERFSGNAGMRLAPTLELRAFASYIDSALQMPGSLTRAALDANPRAAAPMYGPMNARNDFTQKRGALRLNWEPDARTRWTTSVFASERDRFHAMTMGILEQDMDDTGIDSRLAIEFGAPDLTRRLVAGVSVAHLSGREWRSTNVGGERGAATGQTRLRARQDTVYAEYTHGLDARWALQAGWQGVQARRRLDNLMTPGASYAGDFTGSAPKLGLLFTPAQGQQLFANLSGSYEASPFGELVLSPVRPLAAAQGATTFEPGWRGEHGSWRWDTVAYRSQVRRELLALTDALGAALGTVNADRTVHQGLELSGEGALSRTVSLRGQYLVNDFRFDGDAVYGNKHLAGIPPHLLRAALAWRIHPRLRLSPGVEWQPSRTWIDHANTVAADGFALVNLTLGAGWRWFVEGRNLLDRRHVATTAVQANARGLDGAYYFPGDGRAVYAGIQWRMP